MEIGKYMHGNGPECERCKAMDIPEMEDMETTIAEIRAEVVRAQGEAVAARQAGFKEVDWWSKRCDAITAERDQLRAENERLKSGDLGEAYNCGEQKIVDLLGAANMREKQLRAQLETASGNARHYADRCTALEADLAHWKKQHDIELLTADGLADTVAGLRRALEEIANDGVERSRDPRTLIAHAALSASPADHDRRIKAEALREAANKYGADHIESTNEPPREDYGGGYYDGQYAAVNWLMGEVARLEAANATK